MNSSFCFVAPFILAAEKVRSWLRKDYQPIPDETSSHDAVIQPEDSSTTQGANEDDENRPSIHGTTTPAVESNENTPLIRKPTPKISIRQPTIGEESTPNPAHTKTPSPKALTPGSSPGEYSDSSWFRSREGTRRHSRAGSKNSNVDTNSLKEKLRRARRESPRHPHMFFVPQCSQERLITVEAVARDIQVGNDTYIGEGKALEHAKATCRSAKKLYAVLAYIKRGADIGDLLDDHITDDVLPLKRNDDDQGLFALQRRDGRPIKTFESWTDREREKFDRIQWWMTSPVFEDKEHYELDDKTILPFIRFNARPDTQTPLQGGYSEVYPVRVHPAHHDFWESDAEKEEPLIAIKKLLSSEETDFEKEVTILKKLGSRRNPHPHLIKLLATYRQKHKFHLMFPFANANLRKYWEDRPTPAFDRMTVLWSTRQMTGLANALMTIHTFRVTVPLSVAGAGDRVGGKRLQKDGELSVKKGEEWFGRHGDIKPENILWFKNSPECVDERVILQIADFGLGRFHGRDSRSQVDPETVLASPTYEPPECKLRRPVSRAYDLWSLGCVYLEFLTWLLKGSKGIEKFADFRGKESSIGIDDDNFFTITRDPITGSDAVVREQVDIWAQELHQHEKCSGLIHDLIDLTMDQLLIVDSNNRATASCLYWDIKKFREQAEKDETYMLKPVPPPPKQRSWGRSNSTSDVPGNRGKVPALKSNNSFSDRTKAITHVKPREDELKELVDFSSADSPTPKRTKKKSVTWPPGSPLAPVQERIEHG